ncbi:unnamed protein product, partial [Aureobasidium pullulans]
TSASTSLVTSTETVTALLAYRPNLITFARILDKLSPRYRVKINDSYDIDSLKVLIKRCYALDASFVRADSYPKTSDNPRRPNNTSAIGSGSSPSGNRGRSFGNPPKPRTNDTRPNSFLKLSASDR